MTGAPGLPSGTSMPGGDPRRECAADEAAPDHWRVGELELRTAAPSSWTEPPPGAGEFARLVPAAEPGSLSAAREFVRKSLADWGMTDLTWDATTIVSELLTNAITHAAPPLPAPARGMSALQVVLLAHEGRLVIVVTDPCARPPYRIIEQLSEVAAEPDGLDDAPLLAENGRGLRIVAGLSREWGWAPLNGGGKAVWALLAAGD